jgi:hypothetical protein
MASDVCDEVFSAVVVTCARRDALAIATDVDLTLYAACRCDTDMRKLKRRVGKLKSHDVMSTEA